MTMYYIIAVAAPALSSVAHIMFKTFAIATHRPGWRGFVDKRLITGTFLFSLSSIISIISMTVVDFSAFFSFTALSYPFISILSRIVLKETIDKRKIIGNAVIVIGIILYNAPL